MPDGFINVLKPPGMSSHDVVSCVRRVYGTKKVGHAGTLDPAAAGVLPVAVGKATRLIEYITDEDKRYRAELTFGLETDSGDDTGTVTKSSSFVMPSRQEIEEAFAGLTGEIEQTPPMHSAIKIGGNKLCDLARKGIALDVPPRKVTIAKLTLLMAEDPKILFDVDCSKGTYIRSLCRDIGAALGIPAVMSFLVRTKVGAFLLESAHTLEEIGRDADAAMQSMDSVLEHLPRKTLSQLQATAFQQGQKIAQDEWPHRSLLTRVYGDGAQFLGIGKYSPSAHSVVPVKVIAR